MVLLCTLKKVASLNQFLLSFLGKLRFNKKGKTEINRNCSRLPKKSAKLLLKVFLNSIKWEVTLRVLSLNATKTAHLHEYNFFMQSYATSWYIFFKFIKIIKYLYDMNMKRNNLYSQREEFKRFMHWNSAMVMINCEILLYKSCHLVFE